LPALVCFFFSAEIQAGPPINSPLHDHGVWPTCTFSDGACTGVNQHQHRTNHDPAAGVATHGGIAAYVASKSWQNNRTLHIHAAPFAHGHVDRKQAIRFDVHPAVAGGDISAAEAAAWNLNVPGIAGHAADVFAKWQGAGTGNGPKNWANDNDHVAGTGIPWHSSLNFTRVESGVHEVHVEFGEAGAGNAGVFTFATQTITIDDDVAWYWLVNADPGVAPDDFDLYSVLLHEAGHAVALGHFGTYAQGSIMTDEALPTRSEVGGILHDVDASAEHGVLDVYAIPGPEIPALSATGAVLFACLLIMAMAVTVLLRRRQSAAA
jgi:hypothetical protein